MTTDIKERLRNICRADAIEAADALDAKDAHIARLEKELEEARDALILDFGSPYFVSTPTANDGLHYTEAKANALVAIYVRAGDLRAALEPRK